jgi:hypothetical protein
VIHHLVVLTLADTATAEDRTRIADGLAALEGVVPGLEAVTVHTDLGLAPDSADLAFSMRFADEASWRGYSAHPAHVALATEVIKPVVRAKVALQHA